MGLVLPLGKMVIEGRKVQEQKAILLKLDNKQKMQFFSKIDVHIYASVLNC